MAASSPSSSLRPFPKSLASASFHAQFLYLQTSRNPALNLANMFSTQAHHPPLTSTHINLPLRSPTKFPTIPREPEASTPATNPSTSDTHHATETRTRSIKKKKDIGFGTTTDVLRLMDGLGVAVSADIYVSLIKECTESRDLDAALDLHKHIKRSRLRPGLHLLNRLLLMYVSCDFVDGARQLFEGMLERDLNSWATLIVGYMEDCKYEEALRLFVRMLYCSNVRRVPACMVAWVLKVCVYSMNKELGKQVHGWLLKQGGCSENPLSISLINFYGKLRCLDCANIIFQQLSHYNSDIWTAKIVNDCRGGEHFSKVVSDLTVMERAGIKINRVICASILKASGWMQNSRQCGRQIHAKAIKVGIESDLCVKCGLVNMYGKVGLLRDARTVFNMVSGEKSIECWNIMIESYIDQGSSTEAIKLLYQMKAAGLELQEDLLHKVRTGIW